MAHAPVAQVAAALAREQGTPQAPQFVVVRMLVSQPLMTLLSQLWNPALQRGVQVLATQLVVPFALVHARAHAPQLERSLVRLRQTLPQHALLAQSELIVQLPPSTFLQTLPAHA